MGCGSSINLLRKEHLPWLDTLDKWVSNNFIIHDFIVPDFYNMETKLHTKNFLVEMVQSKKEQYKDTTWMISGFDNNIGNYIVPDVINKDDFDNVYCYHLRFVSQDPNYIPTLGRVTAQRGASLSILIDIACTLQYDAIYFIGVDLYSSEYFWTNRMEYENLDIPYRLMYNKAVPSYIKNEDVDKYRKENPEGTMMEFHATKDLLLAYLSDFIDLKKMNMINLSPDSLLADIMLTKSIEECL